MLPRATWSESHRGGSIAVPEGKKDRQLEEAGKKAAKKAEAHDVRTEA